MTSFQDTGNHTGNHFPVLDTDTGNHRVNEVKIKLTDIQRKIFMLMSSEGQKYSGFEIAVKLNIKKSTVYYSIKRLCVLGLLKEEESTYPRSYVLSREGRVQVSSVLVGYDGKFGIYDRSHAWRFKIEVRKFPVVFPDGWESWSMKNWDVSKKVFFVGGLEVEVRKNAESSITILFREVPGPDAQATEDRAYFIAYRTLDVLREELKGIDLGPVELLNVALTGVHHTATGDPYAVRCLQAKTTIIGEAHSVDASTGKAESEFDRLAPGQNREVCQKYGEMVDDVMLGRLDPWKTQEGVKAVDGVLSRMVPVLSEFTVQMAAHVGTAVAVHHGAEALSQAAVVMQSTSQVQADSVKVLVEELRAERLVRVGGGRGWLRRVLSAGVVAVVVLAVFVVGWLG